MTFCSAWGRSPKDRSAPWQLAILVCVLLLFALETGCSRSKPQASADAQTPVAAASQMQVLRFDPALDAVIEPGTKIERIATGFQFGEGPMWRQGRLWFSDLVGNKMFAVTPDGSVQLLIDHSGGLQSPPPGSYTGSNAMATDKDGSVLMLQHGMRRIVRLDSQLGMHPFIERFEGKRFNSPNDLVFAPDGAFWFTDPPFGLAKQNQDTAKELSFNGVFRYLNGKLTAPIRDLGLPNGIAFSPDGKTLYISNSGPKMFVIKYSVGADGALSNATKLIEYPDDPSATVPDGMKVDSAGNIWSAGPGGIRILAPSGKVLGQIKLPESAANLAWGDDGKSAYITATSSIYRLRLRISGNLPLYNR
jgi:gluconolactonase